MGFGRRAKRAWKHTSRALSKPFTGANKDNLKALEQIMVLLSQGVPVSTIQPHQLRYGQYDFTWLTILTDEELREMVGEWTAVMQSEVRTSTNSRFGTTVNVATRRVLMNSTESSFWSALQEVKKEFKSIAEDRVGGFFKSATEWFRKKKNKVDEEIHRNRYVGEYATAYTTVEGVFEDATLHGAETDMDRKILAAGGLWRVVKTGISMGKNLGKAIALPGPKSVFKVVKGGVKLINSLGGLIAGVTDLVRDKDADFRSLTARMGLDAKLDHMKKKYLGAGVIEEGDTLESQVFEGPQRLEKAAEITMVELDELRSRFKHALWWCEVWKLDVEEIEKDIDESDVIKHLRQVFAQVTGEEGLVKPSQIAAMEGYVAPDREQLRKDVQTLKSKVERFEAFLGPRIQKMDDLLAGYDTRRGIATQQKKTASLGLAYDTKRRLAHEIRDFDRSRLRSHTLPREGQRPMDPEETDLETALRTALAKRREVIAPVDDFEDEVDEDWL